MDPFVLIRRLALPFALRCRVPPDLDVVRSLGQECDPCEVGVEPGGIERIWQAVEGLYRSGAHPAIQMCIRRNGRVVLHRALGHATGNGPGDPPDAPREPVSLDTPFSIFSASKAVAAMVIHKLDEQGVLHLEDRVCDFVPGFDRHGKAGITIRHVLGHRAGIPGLPPDSMDLDVLEQPERLAEILRDTRPQSPPGHRLAYHPLSGGFVLGEVVRGATGRDIRQVLSEEICVPLGFHWMRFGVEPEDANAVARNALTGLPLPPPLSAMFRRILGCRHEEAVEMSNDRRFLTSVIPAGNLITNADELCALYQCLLEGGQLAGTRVFEATTVRHATAEQSAGEIDATLLLPARYSLGFQLGSQGLSPFGYDTPRAFGHVGFSNTFSWADPERDIAVALLTSGKPILCPSVLRLFQVLREIGRVFPKGEPDRVVH